MLNIDYENEDYISVQDDNGLELLHIEPDYDIEDIFKEIIDLVNYANNILIN